jgi:ABC-type glycerol-3-phosphate transport system substrate-binding protein
MKQSFVLALCAAAALTACGGGDDNSSAPPATSEVPASASTSVTGWIAYLQRLVASAGDMLEPVDVSAVMPPTDDTAEPAAID